MNPASQPVRVAAGVACGAGLHCLVWGVWVFEGLRGSIHTQDIDATAGPLARCSQPKKGEWHWSLPIPGMVYQLKTLMASLDEKVGEGRPRNMNLWD